MGPNAEPTWKHVYQYMAQLCSSWIFVSFFGLSLFLCVFMNPQHIQLQTANMYHTPW